MSRSYGHVFYLKDDTENENSKTFTLPTSTGFRLLWLHVDFVSSATVGNRRVTLELLDENDAEILHLPAGAVQAASNSYHYTFGGGDYRETTVIGDGLLVSVPREFIIFPGWKLRVRDLADVDGAADDMEVYAMLQVEPNVELVGARAAD